jgi:hypothetical protein
MSENPTNHNKERRFSITMSENPTNYNKERSCSKTKCSYFVVIGWILVVFEQLLSLL